MNIEAMFDRITGSSIFPKIDWKHSSWLIPLHKDSRDYTTFSVYRVHFSFGESIASNFESI